MGEIKMIQLRELVLEYVDDRFRLKPRKDKDAYDLWNALKTNIQSKGFSKKTSEEKIFNEFEKQMKSLGYTKKQDFIAKGSLGIPEKIMVWTNPKSRAIKLQQKKRTDGGWTMILLDGKRIIGWFNVVK